MLPECTRANCYPCKSLLPVNSLRSFHNLFRQTTGNTGNVEENKSLYWNPVIYKVTNPSGVATYDIVDLWFASAYYIFRTKQVRSFPSGLKMRASESEKLSRARATCDGPSPCERTDQGGCTAYGPSNQAQHGFLPTQGCSGKICSL